MTNVDQFESVFRSAAKAVFHHEPIAFGSILIVTDLESYDANLLAERTKQFLKTLDRDDGPTWTVIEGSAFQTVRDLLDVVEQHRPDLICTYRNLHTEGWRWPFTIGDHLEVLTQATTTPVLVLPHPKAGKNAEHAMGDTSCVMAITDHLTGDDRLVNHAAALTEPDGTLWLAHVEDDAAYDRTIEIIGKIPDLDTDVAREAIRKQLLKEPADYIDSCRAGLTAAEVSITVQPHVTMGHHLSTYQTLIGEHAVDLLVMNTKDEDQMAMHGLAYPLAVQMRSIPMLML
ncbi:MAG: hypothetical protein HKN62_13740 [Phycisphaerales bacterium]|nr:hypothetical protein [Phycisphaerales bacterium]